MSVWEALVLGFVQGATEFLPVSSSGHLIVGQALMGIRVNGVLFEVVVHVATLSSILVAYRKRVGELLVGLARRQGEAWRYLGFLGVATIPAALVGLLWEDVIEAIFDRPAVAGVGFLITGLLLWSSRAAMRRESGARLALKVAVFIGLAQALALMPGISRSGSTVVMALWLGIEATQAAEFSFLLAVPAIAGAAALQIPHLQAAPLELSVAALLTGGVAAAVTGILAIWTFVKLLRRQALHHFGTYTLVLGLLFLMYLRAG